MTSLRLVWALAGDAGSNAVREAISAEMGRTMFGSYQLDDEGVPAERVDLVKQGCRV